MNLSEARRWQKFLPTPKFSNFIPKSTTKKNFMFLRLIFEEKSNVATELPNLAETRFSPHISGATASGENLGSPGKDSYPVIFKAPKSPYCASNMSG